MTGPLYAPLSVWADRALAFGPNASAVIACASTSGVFACAAVPVSVSTVLLLSVPVALDER